jgi:hypothetical protein
MAAVVARTAIDVAHGAGISRRRAVQTSSRLYRRPAHPIATVLGLLATLVCRRIGFAQPYTAYDLGAQMSFTRNPNGVWSYGYSVTPSLAPDAFRVCRLSDTHDPIGFWHPMGVEPGDTGYYPYVAANPTGHPRTDPTASWALRPHEVAMEGSNDGRYAVVRFVAPVAGTYRVKARFAGVHFRLSSTDVHVLRGGTSLFDADLEGYGGDPAFHALAGAHPVARYSGRLALASEEVLAFAVGYGRNGTHFNDTTGLVVRVRASAASGFGAK